MNSASARGGRVVAIGEFPAFSGLIEYLGIPIHEDASSEFFSLVETSDGLELRPPGEFDRGGIRATFPPDAAGSARGAATPLSKAFGKKISRVFDMTAGLGSDAYRLATAGYEVRAWERHPAVFALLSSGWGSGVAAGHVQREIAERLSFAWGPAEDIIPQLTGTNLGAYFDPMYPLPKRSSALPKRPLQVLRALLADDGESVELVAAARERLSRVVVKRPHHAPPILSGVQFTVETKLVRFDVYTNPARMEASES